MQGIASLRLLLSVIKDDQICFAFDFLVLIRLKYTPLKKPPEPRRTALNPGRPWQ